MLSLGVTAARARALVSQMCSLASLTSAQRDELLALLTNIERVMKVRVVSSCTRVTPLQSEDVETIAGSHAPTAADSATASATSQGAQGGDDGALSSVLSGVAASRRRLGGDEVGVRVRVRAC
jgi:hypothetical protein